MKTEFIAATIPMDLPFAYAQTEVFDGAALVPSGEGLGESEKFWAPFDARDRVPQKDAGFGFFAHLDPEQIVTDEQMPEINWHHEMRLSQADLLELFWGDRRFIEMSEIAVKGVSARLATLGRADLAGAA